MPDVIQWLTRRLPWTTPGDVRVARLELWAVLDATPEKRAAVEAAAGAVADEHGFGEVEVLKVMPWFAFDGQSAGDIVDAIGPIAELARDAGADLDATTDYAIDAMALFDEDPEAVRDLTVKVIGDDPVTVAHCSVVSDVGHLAAELDLPLEYVLKEIEEGARAGQRPPEIAEELRETYRQWLESEKHV